ncbi:MAG: hypothetical protein J07HR59_01253 [Halorubrum sp. J07HR59]|nr:MAG: hypothetical protein J07HR59_01253 [Halorubrum sp. J07HR59]
MYHFLFRRAAQMLPNTLFRESHRLSAFSHHICVLLNADFKRTAVYSAETAQTPRTGQSRSARTHSLLTRKNPPLRELAGHCPVVAGATSQRLLAVTE